MHTREYNMTQDGFDRIKDASRRLVDAENKLANLKTMQNIKDELEAIKKIYAMLED